MNKAIRIALLVAHVGGLAIGLWISAVGVMAAVAYVPTEPMDLALSRIATTSTIVAITVAFGSILLRRGFTTAAPFLYALTLGGVTIFVEVTGRAMAKNYAPDVGTSFGYAVSTAWIVVAWLAALWAIIWTYRHSRFPLI